MIIGTSGYVIQTDDLINNYPGIKKSILNNLEANKYIDDSLYSKVLYKKATEAIDEIANDIKNFI